MTVENRTVERKFERAAASVRSLIADGTLRPGQPAPSGAALSRMTGFSELTCRKALQTLIKDGDLVPGFTRNARPRVPGQPSECHNAEAATTALSAGLAAKRQAVGLMQAELAALVGCSVTLIGHAETGRLWQSRRFWERADAVLGAAGGLLSLHDAYRAATTTSAKPSLNSIAPSVTTTVGPASTAEAVNVARIKPLWIDAPPTPVSIMIVWSDGAVTAVPVNRVTEETKMAGMS